MESVLHQLYTAYAFERTPSEQERVLLNQLEPYFTRVQATFGARYEAEFRAALYRAEEQAFEEWFRLGASLAGRLLWELLDGAEAPRLHF